MLNMNYIMMLLMFFMIVVGEREHPFIRSVQCSPGGANTVCDPKDGCCTQPYTACMPHRGLEDCSHGNKTYRCVDARDLSRWAINPLYKEQSAAERTGKRGPVTTCTGGGGDLHDNKVYFHLHYADGSAVSTCRHFKHHFPWWEASQNPVGTQPFMKWKAGCCDNSNNCDSHVVTVEWKSVCRTPSSDTANDWNSDLGSFGGSGVPASMPLGLKQPSQLNTKQFAPKKMNFYFQLQMTNIPMRNGSTLDLYNLQVGQDGNGDALGNDLEVLADLAITGWDAGQMALDCAAGDVFSCYNDGVGLLKDIKTDVDSPFESLSYYWWISQYANETFPKSAFIYRNTPHWQKNYGPNAALSVTGIVNLPNGTSYLHPVNIFYGSDDHTFSIQVPQ